MKDFLKPSEELTSLLSRTLEILYKEKMASGSQERYQMYDDWYNSVDDVKLEILGTLGGVLSGLNPYKNPAEESSEDGFNPDWAKEIEIK